MIVGVDEAGRGPLAGPVVASAVVLAQPIMGLNDSKKLSKKRREALFYEITQKAHWSYATSSVIEIETINILQATRLAMKRAVEALSVPITHVYIDGRDTIDIDYPMTALVRGDQKEPAIMAASIVAKYIRDQMLELLSYAYPEYGFDQHAGYATRLHKSMIKLQGLTHHHRKSFCRDK